MRYGDMSESQLRGLGKIRSVKTQSNFMFAGVRAPKWAKKSRTWAFDPTQQQEGEVKFTAKRGRPRKARRKAAAEVKPKPAAPAKRPSKRACHVGDCAIGDHVMFNAAGQTVDGHITRIRKTRNGRRFHVKPLADV